MITEELRKIINLTANIDSKLVAILINDFLGGKILICDDNYYNLVNNEIINPSGLFNEIDIINNSYKEVIKENLLNNPKTKQLYKDLLLEIKDNFNKYGNKEYTLINEYNEEYLSKIPGMFGGHRKLKIYGKMDCPSALKWISKGYYIKQRVFFMDEETAIKAGYRPCSVCMKEEYKKWKEKTI